MTHTFGKRPFVKRITGLLAFCLMTFAIPALALDNIRIGVVTYGPGESMTSRFGHTSLVLLHDNGSKEFYELAGGVPYQGSLPWYLSTGGPMRYQAKAVDRATALTEYVVTNRSIDIRVLNLATSQKSHFARLLANAIAPENAQYDAQLYDRNCTTQVRDMLNEVLAGQLSSQFGSRPAEQPLRNQTLRGLSYSPPLMLGTDLLIGRSGDRPFNLYQEVVLPVELGELLDQATIVDANGNVVPLVSQHQQIYPGSFDPIPDSPPDFSLQFWMTGLMIGLILLALSRTQRYQSPATLAIRCWAVAQSLIGLVIVYFWFVGSEPICDWNENILVFSPLGLAFLAVRHPGVINRLLWLMSASLGLAILAKALPGAQHNWQWIGLVLPAHLVVLYRTLQHRISLPDLGLSFRKTGHHQTA